MLTVFGASALTFMMLLSVAIAPDAGLYRGQAPNGLAEIKAMFGDPANSDGALNEAWESANIQKVAPPAGWILYYQSDEGLVQVSGIRIHRLLATSLVAVLADIWAFAGANLGAGASTAQIQTWLHQRGLDQHGGGFNFRKITGGQGLSLHSFGIAIDWDPENNPRQKPLTKRLPDWWYEIWEKHGWSDGRLFTTPDPMHVQFATGA